MNKNMIKRLGFMAIASFIFAACSSVAHIEKDKNADFSKYKTFAWIDSNSGKKGIRNDTEERIVHEAIRKELEKSGWREVSNDPDVLVSYDVLVERSNKRETNPIYSQSFSRLFYNPYSRRYGSIYYPPQFLGYDDYNVPVREGTLTITIVDTKKDRTVWQGWTTEEVNSKNLTHGEIQSSVRAIFRKFDIAKR